MGINTTDAVLDERIKVLSNILNKKCSIVDTKAGFVHHLENLEFLELGDFSFKTWVP